jgi:uncharacterized transporter YbjL
MFRTILPYLIFWFVLACALSSMWMILFYILGVDIQIKGGMLLGTLTSIPIVLNGQIEVKNLDK